MGLQREVRLIMRLATKAEDLRSLREYRRGVSALAKQVRDIQQLSKFQGTPLWNQNIKSLKVFQKEIEKTRRELQKLVKPSVKWGGGGITKQMVKEFEAARRGVEKLKQEIVGIDAAINKIRELETRFDSVKGAIKENAETLIGLVRHHKKHGSVATVEARKIVKEYLVVQQELKKLARVFNIAFGTAEFRPDTWVTKFKVAVEKLASSSERAKQIFQSLEAQNKKSMHQMILNTKMFANSTIQQISTLDRLRAKVSVYDQFASSIDRLKQSFLEMAVRIEAGGKELRNSSEYVKILSRMMEDLTSHTQRFTGMESRLVEQMKRATRGFLENISAVEKLKSRFRGLDKELRPLIQKIQLLIRVMREGAQSEELLYEKLRLLRQGSKLLTDAFLRLSMEMQKLESASKLDAKAIALLNGMLIKIRKNMNLFSRQTKQTTEELNRLVRTNADASKAMGRMSAKGFADMIISQAAWMAGFQVIFGTLERFKKAIISITELQEGVVRAMRSARSEVMSYSQVFDKFAEAMSKARAETGTSFEDLGEILYQLGSAGLSAEKALAALDSTLANIIGTEAEARGITKLIAGLYLNFADQIVKVDGVVQSYSEVMKMNSAAVEENISLQEKFLYINNLLVIAFNYAQVEMDELRDGLKFMAQSGRVANLALDEMIGILAFLNNRLIKSGMAGRAMRVILSRITKDAKSFADAFDIEIDITQPLKFLDIMEKINKQFGGQVISVGKLGTIFKRLGLRGAEAFNLIQREIGEVKETIKILRRDLEDAADKMKRIRLSDIASQAKIAAVQIETLLRKGLTPLVRIVGMVIKLFVFLSKKLGELNELFAGGLTVIIKFLGYFAAVVGIGVFFTRLGGILKWIAGVIVHLIHSFRGLNLSEEANISITNVLSGVVNKVTASYHSWNASMNATWLGQGNLNTRTAASVGIMGKATIAVRGLTAAWRVLSTVMKTIIWIAAITALVEIMIYLSKTEERLEENRKKWEKLAAASASAVNILETSLSILESDQSTTEMVKAAKERLRGVLYLVGKEYENNTKEIKALIEVGIKQLELEKDLEQIRVGKLWDARRKEIAYLSKEMENQQKILVETEKKYNFLFNSIITGFRRIAAGWKGAFVEIDNLKTLETRINRLNKAVNFYKGTVKELEANLEGILGTDAIRSKQIGELIEKYGGLKKAMQDKLDITVRLRDKILRASVAQEGLSKSTSNVTKEVSYSTGKIDELQKAYDRIDKTVKSLIDSTKKRVSSLIKENDALAESLVGLKIDALEEDISNLTSQISIYSKSLGVVTSLTSSYDKEILKIQDDLGGAIYKVDQFTLAQRRSGKTLKEQKDNYYDLIAAQKIAAIMEEKLARVINDRDIEVGEGIHNVREMRKVTEKLTEMLDIARIAKIRADAEFAKTGIKTEEYKKAYEEVQLARMTVIRAQERLMEQENEEWWNLQRINDVIYEIESKHSDIIGKIEEENRLLSASFEDLMLKSSFIDDSIEGMKQEKKYLEDAKKKVNEQIKNIERMKTLEKNRIDFLQKHGQLSALEAEREKLEIERTFQYLSDSLRKRLNEVAESQKDVADRITRHNSDIIENLKKEMASFEEQWRNLVSVMGETIKINIGFEDEISRLKRAFKKAIDDMQKAWDKLRETSSKPQPSGTGEGFHRGGFVNAKVTSGEGYIPPGAARGNAHTLNTLNKGKTTPWVPRSISRFRGTGGVDNIPAMLPSGSYVLSKQGMAAYEKSVSEGAKGFQEGGEANEEFISQDTGEDMPHIGTFVIAIDRDGVRKEFPVQGDVSVLASLRDELEKEELTRLQ